MTTLQIVPANPRALDISVDEDSLTAYLEDGRVISVPTAWYPRLAHAQPDDLRRWKLLGRGHGIHWPELDEDISIDNLVLGQPSGESPQSFSRWLAWYSAKNAGKNAASRNL